MTDVHLLLGYVAAAAGVALTLGALAAAALGERARLLLDRLILIALGALALAMLSGLPLPLVGRGPADVLHLVYALAAPFVLLAGRYLGRAGSTRRRAVFVGVAGLALLGVTYRLFTTGTAG